MPFAFVIDNHSCLSYFLTMFVCICRQYREQDIRRAAHAGLRSARDVYRELGAGPNCGRCLEFAEEVIRDVHVGSAPPATDAGGAAQAA